MHFLVTTWQTEEPDYRECEYFKHGAPSTCSFGCVDEPACHTSMPDYELEPPLSGAEIVVFLFDNRGDHDMSLEFLSWAIPAE